MATLSLQAWCQNSTGHMTRRQHICFRFKATVFHLIPQTNPIKMCVLCQLAIGTHILVRLNGNYP